MPAATSIPVSSGLSRRSTRPYRPSWRSGLRCATRMPGRRCMRLGGRCSYDKIDYIEYIHIAEAVMGTQLIHGDCLAVLPTLGEASVDCVVTDPPYHLTSG